LWYQIEDRVDDDIALNHEMNCVRDSAESYLSDREKAKKETRRSEFLIQDN